jgi:hypothetical protein
MGAELVNRREGRCYISWSVMITIVGYLIAAFGILVVLPPQDATSSRLSLNAEGVPFNAMAFQVGFNIALVVIWELSMVALFVTVIVLFTRCRRELVRRLVAPPIVLYGAAIIGIVATLWEIT